MANKLYDSGRNAFAKGDIKWLASGGDNIRCFLLESTHVPNLVTHQFLSDIPNDRLGNSGNIAASDAPLLTLQDPSAGICDADDVTFTAVPNNKTVGYILIFKDTGDESTSPLIALIDSGVGLPVGTNGGDILIRWDNGANKIFKL